MKIRKVFAFVVFGFLLSANIFAQEAPIPEGLLYEVVNGRSITITKYTEYATSVIIPASIDGLPITSIGDWAFYDCTNLTGVTIPASVTAIGNWAFAECDNLISVTIPSLIRTIGDYVFHSC
jgi:hypothetical protein